MEEEGYDEFDDLFLEEEDENKLNIAEGPQFRDIGFEGRYVGWDPDLQINIVDIEHPERYDAKTVFSLQLVSLLRTWKEVLQFGPMEEKQIKVGVHELPMLRFKDPLAFILGYYLFLHKLHKPQINVVQHILDGEHLSLFECIKYCRYWRTTMA